MLAICSCSDSSNGTDGGQTDATAHDGSSADYGPLYACEQPGQSCNAHNSCAIDPVCGTDKLCRPSSVMNCDDDLECTTDTCAGPGLCKNTPKKGTCMLPVPASSASDGGSADGGASGDGGSGSSRTVFKCFKKGDKHPTDQCKGCQPDEGGDGGTSSSSWAPLTGGSCDDHNACTKDDYCQAGVCKGTNYAQTCADNLSCTTDPCDGKGGCLKHKIKSDYCLINGACYKDKAKHPSGSCFTCDVSKSQTSWTAVTNSCLIDNICYTKGAKNAGGCAECDPATSTSKWTVKGTTHCLINNTCVASGTKDPTPGSCSSCQPSKSTTDYSADSGYCKIAGKCYKDGAKHPDGCATCDVSKSRSAWTPNSSSVCVVNNACGVYCSGTCSDLTTDEKHCGSCTNACKSNEVCIKSKCQTSAGIHLVEVNIGGSDYVAIKNVTSTSKTLTGYTVYFDDSRGTSSSYDFSYTLPANTTLNAGATLYLCESSTCSGSGRINIGKNIMYDPSGSGTTYLCSAACSSTTLIDLHSFQGSGTPDTLLYSATFKPGPSTGISTSNESTHSFVRQTYQGAYPSFLQADWKVATKTK